MGKNSLQNHISKKGFKISPKDIVCAVLNPAFE
jgi:hypothetical protein